MCAFNGNKAAFALRTDKLDSHKDLGINAPPREQVVISKEVVCSPIIQDGFHRVGQLHGVEAAGNTTVTVTEFLYGAAEGDYTWSYNPAAAYDNVPFAVNTLLHNSTGPAPWDANSNLSRSNADVVIVFIAPNSIKFRNRTADPIFSTTYSIPELTNTNARFHVYSPDYQVGVIACSEQYSICNPNLPGDNNSCTPPDGQTRLMESIDALNLNPAQYVTALRMIYMIADSNTYSSIDGIGPDALQIWSQVHNFITPQVPDNQWQIEVKGWMDTTLAKWQAFMVNFADNTAVLGEHGHLGFPKTNSTLQPHWEAQCGQQKISNVGNYQNVSIFGFAMIWAMGGFIIILSLALKRIVKSCRQCRGRMQHEQSRRRRIAWNIDGKFQQQRIALQSTGYSELIGGEDDVPYLEQQATLPLSFCETEMARDGKDEKDTYWCKRGEEKKTDTAAKGSSSQSSSHSHPARATTPEHLAEPTPTVPQDANTDAPRHISLTDDIAADSNTLGSPGASPHDSEPQDPCVTSHDAMEDNEESITTVHCETQQV